MNEEEADDIEKSDWYVDIVNRLDHVDVVVYDKDDDIEKVKKYFDGPVTWCYVGYDPNKMTVNHVVDLAQFYELNYYGIWYGTAKFTFINAKLINKIYDCSLTCDYVMCLSESDFDPTGDWNDAYLEDMYDTVFEFHDLVKKL